jgi:hypothetical protein
MRGRNGTWHRYYYCRGHGPLRTSTGNGRCPERNIRADELDEYVFAQVRQVLLDPRQLIAAERAVIAGAPADENDLVAAQLKRLDSALQSNERERARLIDAYQAGLLELNELTSRTAAITARRDQLTQEKNTLTRRSAELATENMLRRRLAGFAEQAAASLDDLDTDGACDSSSRRSASQAGASRSTSRSRCLTTRPTTTPRHPDPSGTTDRQTICASVPFVIRTCAWCSSRSTVAFAIVLGISSSNPDPSSAVETAFFACAVVNSLLRAISMVRARESA